VLDVEVEVVELPAAGAGVVEQYPAQQYTMYTQRDSMTHSANRSLLFTWAGGDGGDGGGGGDDDGTACRC